MKYRVATLNDVDSLVEIERKYFSNPWTKNQFSYEIDENEFSTILVCEDEGKIVGFLVYWILFDNAQICNICVIDEYKKKGIASTLFDMAEEEFKKNECFSVTLEVRVSNDPAISLYTKRGFTKVCVKKGYYQDGEDAYYMMKGVGY